MFSAIVALRFVFMRPSALYKSFSSNSSSSSEEFLHVTVVKFITSPDLCAHLTWKCQNLHFAMVTKP